jgi:hypothetical protein
VTINNKIRVTNFAGVNNINFPTRYSHTLPTDWTSGGTYYTNYLAYNNGVYIGVGYRNTGALSKIIKSTDLQTFTEVTTSNTLSANNDSSLFMQNIGFSNNTWLILSQSTNKVIKSVDNGDSWTTVTNLPSTAAGNLSGIGGTSNTFMLRNNSGGVATYLTTNAGTSWSTVTDSGLTGPAELIYCEDRWVALNTSGQSKYSVNNGTSWSTLNSSEYTLRNYYYLNRILLSVGSANGNNYIFISRDKGITFTPVKNTSSMSSGWFFKVGDRYYCTNGTNIYSSTDLLSWYLVNGITGDSNVVSSTTALTTYTVPLTSGSDFSQLSYIPIFRSTASSSTVYSAKGTPTINNGDSSYIDVTASKGSVSQTIRVPVIKNSVPTQFNSMSVYPSSYTLASTVDGVVAADAFTNANITVTCYTDGIDTTASWTLSKSDSTGLSTTLTGSNIKINSLATANDTATCTVVAFNNTTGKVLRNTINISKNKDDNYSGINRGASFTAYSTTQTAVYLKFLTTGYFQIKYGAGAYANAGQWYTPINVASPAGGSYYMIMEYTSFTGDTLNAGTGGVVGGTTWNQMNIDREYHLTNAVSGRHVIDLNPRFATSNTGANANVGVGRLELNVP